jgi:hypothetical protein
LHRTAYRGRHPAFACAELAAFPARVGIRESRRVRGEDTVTGEAVLRGIETPDCVALGTWPMESREKPTGPRWRYPEDDRPTQIPLGALKAAGVANLWTAGRCLSCDHQAQAALRVIGTCLATGQAAGLAAAWQARHGVPPDAPQVRADRNNPRPRGRSMVIAGGGQLPRAKTAVNLLAPPCASIPA